MRTFIALILVSLIGCKQTQTVGTDSAEVPDFETGAWPDAMRLSNGNVNLIVVPSNGRIMRYGFPDTPNVLWTNPELGPGALEEWSEDRKAKAAATTAPAWKNWGGDKAWPWPQDQWPLYAKRSWPPPSECDQAPMRSNLIGGMGIRLESPPISGYGVRLVRDITLDRDGTRVTMVTRFEQASADLPPPELAAWQITQIAGGGKMYAKLALNGRVTALPPHPAWTTTRPVAPPNIVILDPPPPVRGVKMGLDADALALAKGELLFVARSQTAMDEAKLFRPGERAQVYIPEAKKGEKLPAYVEFEFTSPRKDLARKQVPELKVTWELYRIENGTWNDAAVAEILRL